MKFSAVDAFSVEPHPLLRVSAVLAEFEQPIGGIATPEEVIRLLHGEAGAPLRRDEAVREAVRDMLRRGGYKPTGRGKPASEYLVRAVAESALRPINPAVDVCNAVSLHSGLPISVVDLDLAREPFRIAVARAGSSYVFNATGQEIDLGGLLCLFDGSGPCANAVRDSQLTKTRAETRRTLSIIWGVAGYEQRLQDTEAWYRSLLSSGGAETIPVVPAGGGA